MSERNLSKQFNDPANKKFHRLWEREADIASDVEMAMEWYKNWNDMRDNFLKENNQVGVANAQGLIDYWDRYLVKVVAACAKHKAYIEAGNDGVAKEFGQKNLTLLQPLYDALSKLGDAEIKSGKAIYEAILPLMANEEPAPEQKPALKDPTEDGNPFKKGPSA